MIIRRAKLDDLRKIQELNNQLFELELANFDKYLIKDWPLSSEGRQYFENAIKNDFVVVAEIEGVVVGYLFGGINHIPYYSFKTAELYNMCVESEYRNCGVGKALYRKFEEFHNAQGINHFVVTASFKNKSACVFYEKMGFQKANMTFVKF